MPVYLPGLTAGGKGYGGAPYGYSPYGAGAFPRLPVVTTGGYGGAPYGTSSYGAADVIPPQLSGANALDGFRVEIFFSEEMRDDAALGNPANYVFTPTFGVPMTSVSVAKGTAGIAGGFTTVIVTHTGSTLGGQYQATASGLSDIAGNPIGLAAALFSALGDTPTITASLPAPDDGRTVRLDFRNSRGDPQPLLTEAVFSPGVDDTASYGITTTYPVVPTLGSATQDPLALYQVDLDVHPMTSATYDLTVGPSLAYNYQGTGLPSSDPTFTGVEIGAGTSAPSPANGLLLSKGAGGTYGWAFEDTTGRILPGSTFRVAFRVDVTGATIAPAIVGSTLAVLSVSDGAFQIDLTLEDVAGTKVISILSGALSLQVPAAWDLAAVEITLIRNQQAGFYTLLFDGVPLSTFSIASANGAAVLNPGTGVVLTTASTVSLFSLLKMAVTASSTLFTSTWNFIHGLPLSYTGSFALSTDRILTRRGPLVRGWGDATPATIDDVEIRVAGVPVVIAGVNPYVGEIYPLIPIPLSAPGTVAVAVDYIWFTNPAFPVAGLNTRGLNLNVWNRTEGHTAGAVSPTPASSLGAMATNRFPMGIVLPPLTRRSPKKIGHRYIGFQKDYSALLNEPTTLLLNQNPNAISVGNVSATALLEVGSFDGLTLPGSAATPWTLDGVDGGALVGDGTYRVLDASSGPFGVGVGAVYKRDLDLSLPAVVSESARFYVESYTADGVFTGVSFGIHDGNHLLLVGALIVSGVQHVGVLLDADLTHLEAGWSIGPSAVATATTTTTLSLSISSLPPGVGAGSRFRVGTGSQAGVYTISECGLTASTDGLTVAVSLTTPLPAEIDLFGNDTFTIFFETLWATNLISLRAQVQFPVGSAQVYLGGAVSGLVASLTELPSFPAQTALLLPATKKGVAFWGSLSRRATNSSIWDLTQYTSNPERILNTVQGLTAQTEMNVLPEDDPNDPWYIVGGFGYAQVDVTGDQTVIKSTSGSRGTAASNMDLEYSYQRVEPYLTNKVTTDTEAEFRVESGILGAGDAQIVVRDGTREVTFKTLLYTQAVTERVLVTDLPQASLSGLRDPVTDGWPKAIGTTIPDPFVRGQTLEFTKATGQTGVWGQELPNPTLVDYEGVILESRFSVESYTVGSAGIGVFVAADIKVSPVVTRLVGLTLGTGTILLLDVNSATVASFAFAWDDGEPHDYRLLCDPTADIAVLVVDDVVIGSTALTGFVTSASSSGLSEAFLGGVGTGVAAFTVHSISVTPFRPLALGGSTLGRTFGILLREGASAPDDIDSYRIPRADATAAPNSSTTAIPVLMDWQVSCHVRLYLDPTWGVSFYRPDLALPPWATGDFVTETTDPTAAWATVEYPLLPVQLEDRGCVNFGAPDPRAITQQRWNFMRYRIRGAVDGFGIAPQWNVLNRVFTFKSGEFLYDVTPEVYTITSRTSTLVYIPDSAVYADRVFVVQVAGVVLPAADYGFDEVTQNLILTTPLPSAQYPVTVTFAPGKPITKNYLCSQPIDGSVTLLNEGTPPVPMSRDEASTSSVFVGSGINDPTDVLDDAESLILNDPYRFVEFTDGPDALYAGTEFCEVEDGDDVYIHPLCDGPGPGEGLAGIGIEGLFTSEAFSVIEGPAGPWGKSSPVIKGSSTHFSPMSVLFTSGGSIATGGVLGPGSAILWPNQRGSAGEIPSMGLNQDFRMILTDVTPRSENIDIPALLGDNVPASRADPLTDPNADGAPGVKGNGAVVYLMEDFASSGYSKLGPWGGLAGLSVDSLLGGGAPLAGVEFVLNGGAAIAAPSVTTGVIEAAN